MKNNDNFNKILDINNRLNQLNDRILDNKNLTVELITNHHFECDKYIGNIYIKNIDSECPVCFEIMSIINFKRVVCNHNLCYKCFYKWSRTCILNNNNITCPICRISMNIKK